MVLFAKIYSVSILSLFALSVLKDMPAAAIRGGPLLFAGGHSGRAVVSCQDTIGDDLAGSDGMALPRIPSLKAISDTVRNNCGI